MLELHAKLKEMEIEEWDKAVEEMESMFRKLHKQIRAEARKLSENLDKYTYEEALNSGELNKTIKAVDKSVDKFQEKYVKFFGKALVTAYLLSQDSLVKLYGYNKPQISNKAILKRLEEPWSGLNWYDRVLKHMFNLKLAIRQVIQQGLVAGDKAGVKDRIEKEFKTSISGVKVLMVSEFSRAGYVGTVDIMQSKGVLEVIYNSLLDNSCNKCKSLHGKVYALGEEPQLPMHANCKCFYTPKKN